MDSYIALRWGHFIYSLRKVRTNGKGKRKKQKKGEIIHDWSIQALSRTTEKRGDNTWLVNTGTIKNYRKKGR